MQEQEQYQEQEQDCLPEDKTTSSIYVHHFPAGGSTNNVVEALRVLERSVFKKHESLVLVLVFVFDFAFFVFVVAFVLALSLSLSLTLS